ncbi:MAG: alpha/beta hydrolase [Leptolyngbya sp. SIO4C1]|nr:alpha/beta hydrolase [Leptolyngbya sp. SIO4C1]
MATVKTADTAPVVQWGSGETVLVLLHYFSGAAVSWQWMAAQLGDDYRCVALNLPGFGGTPPLKSPSLQGYADWVRKEIEQLGIQRYTLVGHSMGGKLALQVAADAQGDQIQQLFLMAPSPATQEPMPEEEKRRLLNHHPSRDNAETTVSSAAQQPLTDEQREVAIQTHVMSDSSAWRWWLLEGMTHSIAAQMQRVQMPVTVLASKDDPVIPYDKIQTDVVDLLQQAQLVAIQEVGHLIPLEVPELAAQQLRTALRS